MSPRVAPLPVTIYPPPSSGAAPTPDLFADSRRAVRARDTDEAIGDPYRAQYARERAFTASNVPVHSFFRDLLLVSESDARVGRSLERALREGGRGGRDQGPIEIPAAG